MSSAVLRRFVLSLVALTLLPSVVYLQKVRLRSQITPNCTAVSPSVENAKFSDLFGDGNVAVLGSYGCRGAFIFDITNPDAPVLASWYNPVTPTGVNYFLEAVVVGNRAYFGSGGGAAGGDGVHMVDVSDPYNPVFLGKVTQADAGGFNTIHEMVVFNQNGSTFLIENLNSTSNKILKVINVTNPAAPVFVRDIVPTDPQWVHAMVVKGNRMFTSGWGNSGAKARTEIYDISNIATQAPALLGFISDPSAQITAGNNMHSAWPSEDGNYLYSCRETNNGNGDVRVYNISNPASPLLVNRITMTDLGLNAVTPHNPVVAGNYLYVSWYQAGVQVFDISSPSLPVRVGQYDTYQPTFTPPAEEAVTTTRRSGSRSKLAAEEPWDIICGSERLQNSLPVTYDGNWAVFPFLGQDKVLAGDLKNGLLILDATQVSSPLRNRAADFDGDRRTDLSVLRPSSGSWQIESSSSSTSMSIRLRLGTSGDQVVAGDYDGDGRADIGVYRPSTGEWLVRKLRSKASREYLINGTYGLPGDIPIPGDYDADGRTDVALYRYDTSTTPGTPRFVIWQSTLGQKTVNLPTNLGITSDSRPVAGDYDGDGKTDLAIWHPTGGWIIKQSSSSIINSYSLGQFGDRPVSGDFNGNGISDLAVYRPSSGEWFSGDPITGSNTYFQWGLAEDVALPADYDGDGKTDYSIFRPSTNEWSRVNSSNGATVTRTFGQSGDTPVPLSVQPQ